MKPSGVTATELVAFDVEIYSLHCIVFAANAGKARWIAVKGYRDAGYGHRRQWPYPRAHRVPRYDRNPLKDRESRCWSPEYVEAMNG